MYIIGHNPCMSCIIHNASKIKAIFIVKDRKEDYVRSISNINLKNKVNFINKSDLKKKIIEQLFVPKLYSKMFEKHPEVRKNENLRKKFSALI